MQHIKCINFVNKNASNILLIGSMHNTVQEGYYLKHFKNTHNIYALIHNINNNFEWYYDLPTKHEEIIKELNKHNLYKFTISTISFGGLLAFYIIFHMKERVEKAFIHDFTWDSFIWIEKPPYKVYFSVKNWCIPKHSNIPIVFYLFTGTHVTKLYIKKLLSIFSNIKLILIINPHIFLYNYKEKEHPFIYNIHFFLCHGFTINKFWNKYFKLWIENKYSFKKTNSLAIKHYIYKYKNNKSN